MYLNNINFVCRKATAIDGQNDALEGEDEKDLEPAVEKPKKIKKRKGQTTATTSEVEEEKDSVSPKRKPKKSAVDDAAEEVMPKTKKEYLGQRLKRRQALVLNLTKMKGERVGGLRRVELLLKNRIMTLLLQVLLRNSRNMSH